MTKTKLITITLTFLVLLTLAILFLPMLKIKTEITNFYKENDQSTFISNYDTVKSDDFDPEVFRLNYNPINPKYVSIYKATDYKTYSNAVVADFFYFKRSGLLSWKVEKYESSFTPYFENDENTFDDLYETFKNSILEKEVKKGLTSREEIDLNESFDITSVKTGDLIDYVSTDDKSITFEILAGKKYGSNYVVEGSTGVSLGIENIITGIFSTDNKYFIFTTGEYFEPTGELINIGTIWKMNLADNSITQVLNLTLNGLEPSDMMLYSDGNIVIYGTKDTIGKVNLDGSNNEIVVTFEAVIKDSEEFYLPEVYEVVNGKAVISYPKENFAESRVGEFVEVVL